MQQFFFITSSAFSIHVGKSSIHPLNVSIMTNSGIYTLYDRHLGDVHLPVLSWVGPMPLDGMASWGLRAPWWLFNWQVGQEEITYLIVIWRPVPLNDLSSNFWRAFSPKWVMACKGLTNFHWRFPGQKKRISSFWNYPIWSSWKSSLLALRVSPSDYEGVSGKLACGTKVETPIRSLFCNAALLAAWSAVWLSYVNSVLPFWCPLQWKTHWANGLLLRAQEFWSPYLIEDPWVVKWPLSFQIAACAWSTRKAYLKSV